METDFSEECYEHDWNKPEDLGTDWWRVTCKRCGEIKEDLVYVEYWENKTITIKGKEYRALKAWGNVSRCSECNEPIFDIPLIFWSASDPSKALTFCKGCVVNLKIMEGRIK